MLRFKCTLTIMATNAREIRRKIKSIDLKLDFSTTIGQKRMLKNHVKDMIDPMHLIATLKLFREIFYDTIDL